MATEMAIHGQGIHPTHIPMETQVTNTDQDVLFDLILQQVPVQKRALLSTSWSKDYLNRLTSLPARALHNEPAKLRDEQLKVERDMSELAFRDYKAFILVKDCKQEVQSTFETMGQHLDHFQETIPQFVETLSGFSGRVADILQRQHIFNSILASHSQLLEVLEIPLLMETCVRNGYYNEALELAAHVQRLVVRYPGIGIIQEIDLKVAQGKEMMLTQLLAQLREPIKLPVALRIIGFLRRIGSFKTQQDMVEEEEQGAAPSSSRGKGASAFSASALTSSSATGPEDESPLKMLFLKSRGLYMNVQLSKVALHKGDSFSYLKKYIDVTRECLFDILTYYKSIFGGVDMYGSSGISGIGSDYSNGSSSSSPTSSLSKTRRDQALGGSTDYRQQKQHGWTTDNLLADFVTYRTQALLQILQTHIPLIHDTSALSSILTQLMYFGANMGKIGFDLRYLVTSLFEEAVVRVVGGAFQRGADDFMDSLGGEGYDEKNWQLPSQWVLGGTGRASSTSSPTLQRAANGAASPSPSGAASSLAAGGSSLSPQMVLMDYPALAYLTNSYLTALNALRLLAPLSVAIPLREILVQSLMRVVTAMDEYDRFVFGERSLAMQALLKDLRYSPSSSLASTAETAVGNSLSTTNGTTSSSSGLGKARGLEGSALLNEQKTMDGFVIVYKRAVHDYILKCFDEGIYGGLIKQEIDEDEEEEEQAQVQVAEKGESAKPPVNGTANVTKEESTLIKEEGAADLVGQKETDASEAPEPTTSSSAPSPPSPTETIETSAS